MSHPDLKLPEGCNWGPKSGDYWPILRNGRYLAQFGGVALKVTPEHELQADLDYTVGRALMRAAP